MNEKPQNLKIAINSLKLNETIFKFFVTQQYIDPSLFKILYLHDDYLFLKLRRNNYA